MRGFLLALSLLVCLACSCRDRQERPGETTTTGAALELVPASIAHDRIIAAQCMREQLCVEVGLARDASSSCADHVKSARCAHPLDARVLEECLDAIYNASCSIELEARSASLEACRFNVLCRAP